MAPPSHSARSKEEFGRGKEKRDDCRLLVLVLCINTDGFICYSSILDGNTADPKSLPDMVERLMVKSPVGGSDRALVVMDAGIATSDNPEGELSTAGYNKRQRRTSRCSGRGATTTSACRAPN